MNLRREVKYKNIFAYSVLPESRGGMMYIGFPDRKLYSLINDKLKILYDEKVDSFKISGNHILLQCDDKILKLDESNSVEMIVQNDSDFIYGLMSYLINGNPFINCVKNGDFRTSYFLIWENKKLNKVDHVPYFGFISKRLYFSFSKNFIFAYEYSGFSFGLVWKVDFSNYGFKTEYQGDKLVEVPNTVHNNIFGSDTDVFVPLEGGQLVALDASTGSFRWMLEMEYSGFYDFIEDKIYKISGSYLYEIDAISGTLLKSKKVIDIMGDPWAVFTGEFKAYDDVLLIKNQMAYWVAVINRRTFELEFKADIGTTLGSNKDSMYWIDRKLYVSDIWHNLSVFELSSNE